MIYELAKIEDLQNVYDVVQHTIKTIYPKYYPKEVVDFFCEHHNMEAIAKDIENGYVSVLKIDENIVATGCFVDNHMNRDMKVKTGKCHSMPTVQENGKIELSEQWEWTSGDFSKGESLLVEV